MIKQVRLCDLPDCPNMTERRCVACERDACDQHSHVLGPIYLSVFGISVVSRNGILCVDCWNAFQQRTKPSGLDSSEGIISVPQEVIDRWEREAVIWIKSIVADAALGGGKTAQEQEVEEAAKKMMRGPLRRAP